jgi:hypothetical protein
MPNRYWVGGTGTWDKPRTAHWSTSSGGASGASGLAMATPLYSMPIAAAARSRHLSLESARPRAVSNTWAAHEPSRSRASLAQRAMRVSLPRGHPYPTVEDQEADGRGRGRRHRDEARPNAWKYDAVLFRFAAAFQQPVNAIASCKERETGSSERPRRTANTGRRASTILGLDPIRHTEH